MNAVPRPGDTILLIGSEEDKDLVELLCFILRSRKLQITMVTTIVEGIEALAQYFDWVWLHLPLPDVSASHLREDLLMTSDLVDRVGSESPRELLDRLTTTPVGWYRKLSQQTWKISLNEDDSPVRSVAALYLKTRSKTDDQWLWIRTSTDEERAWVRQLLEQSISK